MLRRSSQSSRLQRKGRWGGLWGYGERVVACGLDPEGPVLAPLTALWLPSSRLCPHQWSVLGLPTVPGPGAAPPGDSVTQAPLSGDGRPPWDPSPSEMEQLQKLGSPLPPCSGSSPTFPRCLGRLRCLQGPDPGVATDQGPWDKELLPDSREFTLGLPPPQGESLGMENRESEPGQVSMRRGRTRTAGSDPPGRLQDPRVEMGEGVTIWE